VVRIALPPLHAAKMLHRPTGDNGSASGIWPVAIVLHRGNGLQAMPQHWVAAWNHVATGKQVVCYASPSHPYMLPKCCIALRVVRVTTGRHGGFGL
jgi:hypothetical protein